MLLIQILSLFIIFELVNGEGDELKSDNKYIENTIENQQHNTLGREQQQLQTESKMKAQHIGEVTSRKIRYPSGAKVPQIQCPKGEKTHTNGSQKAPKSRIPHSMAETQKSSSETSVQYPRKAKVQYSIQQISPKAGNGVHAKIQYQSGVVESKIQYTTAERAHQTNRTSPKSANARNISETNSPKDAKLSSPKDESIRREISKYPEKYHEGSTPIHSYNLRSRIKVEDLVDQKKHLIAAHRKNPHM